MAVMTATTGTWKSAVISIRYLTPPTFYCLDRRGLNVVSWCNQYDPFFGCRCDVSDSWTKTDFVSFMSVHSNKSWQWPDVLLVDSIN
jgi:hypothetical protein